MENTYTLHAILRTQDFSDKHADKVCEDVLNDNFDPSKDLITGYIVESWIKNDYGMEKDSLKTDLDYAINQLTRARAAILNR